LSRKLQVNKLFYGLCSPAAQSPVLWFLVAVLTLFATRFHHRCPRLPICPNDQLFAGRGLSLLDRYTLEDLCDYLPARKHRCPPRRRQRPQQHKPIPGDDCFPEIDLNSPPPSPSSRSSSCSSSVSLSLHKRTVCAALRKKSTSLPSRIPHTARKPEASGGCLVNYLLTCSRLGSNAISDFLPTDSDPCLYCSTNGVGTGVLENEMATSNCYQGVLRCPACLAVADEVDRPPCHLLASDWRRGRSDGLVCVVAGCDAAVCISGTVAVVGSPLSPSLSSTDLLAGGGCACSASSSSRPPKPRLSCLVAGRFLPGEDSWRGIWPKTASTKLWSGSAEADLVTWVSAWIQAGGVLFFAQLDDNYSSGGKNFIQNASHELCWRHRLVVGISGGKHIHLSNPLEVVSASWLLSYLAKLTTLSVHKSDVMRLWSLGANVTNLLSAANASGDNVLRSGLLPASAEVASSVSFSPSFGQDLSLLSQQRDIRWSRFNILGK
uniref:Protein kinase domain-containing protein n=1 Tax=Schistocephalus solidus TaxID=70667 RepID=A0A183TR24_SCHSO